MLNNIILSSFLSTRKSYHEVSLFSLVRRDSLQGVVVVSSIQHHHHNDDHHHHDDDHHHHHYHLQHHYPSSLSFITTSNMVLALTWTLLTEQSIAQIMSGATVVLLFLDFCGRHQVFHIDNTFILRPQRRTSCRSKDRIGNHFIGKVKALT
jgi:hypothetical protein